MDKLSILSRIKAEIYNYSGLMGVYVNDFKGNILELNSGEEFETASCIKVFVLAELYRQIHENKIKRDDVVKYTRDNYVVGSGILRALDVGVEMSVRDIAILMIIVSDNIATNILIEYLGVDNINKTCADLGLQDTILHNKIDFDKYEKLGTTTPKDYGKFFELLYNKQMWSEEISDEIINILKEQHYNTMLTKSLPPYFLDAEDTGDEELISIASKSGSMNACRNDGGIIFTPYGGYVVVIFTKNFKDNLYYQDHESNIFGSKVSRLIFDHYLSLKGSLE